MTLSLDSTISTCHHICMDPVRVEPTSPTVEVSMQQAQSPEAPSPWVRPLLILLSIVAFLVLATLSIFLFVKSPAPATQYAPTAAPRMSAVVSGQVYFQGYAPAGSYISLAERSEGH